jgi:protein PsiE
MNLNKSKQPLIQMVEIVEGAGLLVIALATLIAFGFEIGLMIDARRVTLADLLLMFIYLEVLAMVAVYLNSGKLPVRMPLYIAIVALARYLILDMKNLDTMRIIGIGVAIMIVSLSVLIIRYGHCRFSYNDEEQAGACDQHSGWKQQ